MRGAASACVADEIGKILLANLAELRCTAIEVRLRTLLPRFHTAKTPSRHCAPRHFAMQQLV